MAAGETDDEVVGSIWLAEAINKRHSGVLVKPWDLTEMPEDWREAYLALFAAERVKRVALGYTNAKGERVEGLGGGFRFCELGEPLFGARGQIRESVTFAELARHVYFTEMGESLPRERVSKSPLIGECRGVAVYLLFNGILGDRSANSGNVLTRAVLAKLPKFPGPKVIYASGCLMSRDRLQSERIVFRQTPYEIKVA